MYFVPIYSGIWCKMYDVQRKDVRYSFIYVAKDRYIVFSYNWLTKNTKNTFSEENICVYQKIFVILRPIVFIFTQTYKNLQ